MESKKQTAQDGVIESRVRQWINDNITASPTYSRRDVCGITRRADRALGLGMTGGIARDAIRSFVARVLTQRGQLPA